MKRLILLIVVAALGFYVVWPAFSGYQINNALKANDAAALEDKIDFPSVRQSMRDPILAKIDERMATSLKKLGPAAMALGGQIKKDKIAAIIDAALADVVNPQQVGEIYGKGGDFAGAMRNAVLRQIEKAGGIAALLGGAGDAGASGTSDSGSTALGGIKLPSGLGGLLGGKKAGNVIGQLAGKSGLDSAKLKDMLFPKKSGGTPARSDKPSNFGLSNIKNFGFAGPLALQLGIAKDSAADQPDVTGEMSFTDFDWKVTRLIPNLDRF